MRKKRTMRSLHWQTPMPTIFLIMNKYYFFCAQSKNQNNVWVDPSGGETYVRTANLASNCTGANCPVPRTSPSFSANTATRSIAENSAADTNIGAAVSTTDTDGDTLTYSLSGTDASKFAIVSTSGQIQVKTGNIPDYEDDTSHSVTVGVTDGRDQHNQPDSTVDDTIAVTISVTDANEPPDAPGAPTVARNSTNPSTSLDVSWSAPSVTDRPAISDYDVQYRIKNTTNPNTWTSHDFTGTGTSTTIGSLSRQTRLTRCR